MAFLCCELAGLLNFQVSIFSDIQPPLETGNLICFLVGYEVSHCICVETGIAVSDIDNIC